MWSAGSSTGEEPYTLAMVLLEWLKSERDFSGNDVSVFASDVSRAVLERARRGVYSQSRVSKGVAYGLREEYFERYNDEWRVGEKLRSIVSFSQVNLTSSLEHLGFFDVIFCRNVIIYFSEDIKRHILESFARMLNPGGALIMGASETIYQLSDKFRPVHFGQTTYFVVGNDGI